MLGLRDCLGLFGFKLGELASTMCTVAIVFLSAS